MNRHDEIKNAYKSLGGDSTFYDGMITCSTLLGKAVCKLVWNMDKRKNDHYLELAISGIWRAWRLSDAGSEDALLRKGKSVILLQRYFS